MIICVGLIAATTFCLTACGGEDEEKKTEESDDKNTKKERVVENNNMEVLDGDYKSTEKEFYFVDGKGNIKTYIGYNKMENFYNGIAKVERDGKHMLIDVDEKVLLEEGDIKTYHYTDGTYYVIKKNGKLGLYNSKIEKVFDCDYVDINLKGTEMSPDLIMAEKEDTTVDVYTHEGQLLMTIPAGYSLGSFYDIDANEYIGMYKIRYGGEYKYFNSATLEEITEDESKILNKGLTVEDGIINFYDEKGNQITKVEYNNDEKGYHMASSGDDFYTIEFAKRDDWGEYISEIYNKKGELLCSGEQGTVYVHEIGGVEYLINVKDDKKIVMNSKKEEIFTFNSDAHIVGTDVKNIFYIENEDGIVAYDAETFEKINGKAYKSEYDSNVGDDACVFIGEDNLLVCNEYGDYCEIDKVECNSVYKLPNGYVALEGENIYIVDVVGSGNVHEISRHAKISALVPYYESDDVYYSFKGEVIYEEE